MDSIEDRLGKDERIVYRTHGHWAITLGPMLVIIIGGLALRSQGFPAMVLMLFGLVWGTLSYISLQRSHIGLTDERLLINAGFPFPKPHDIPLHDIAAIDYHQPSLGSMLNFGKIIVVSPGQSRYIVRFVSSPVELVTNTRQQISAARASTEDPS